MVNLANDGICRMYTFYLSSTHTYKKHPHSLNNTHTHPPPPHTHSHRDSRYLQSSTSSSPFGAHSLPFRTALTLHCIPGLLISPSTPQILSRLTLRSLQNPVTQKSSCLWTIKTHHNIFPSPPGITVEGRNIKLTHPPPSSASFLPPLLSRPTHASFCFFYLSPHSQHIPPSPASFSPLL